MTVIASGKAKLLRCGDQVPTNGEKSFQTGSYGADNHLCALCYRSDCNLEP